MKAVIYTTGATIDGSTDHYRTFETRGQAQAFYNTLTKVQGDLLCAAIVEIEEATEPQWISTPVRKAWEGVKQWARQL